jgi:hypothetical protein
MGAIKKAGVQFHAKIDTNRDLIGQAAQFSAEVIVDADGSILTDASANASIGSFVEVGSTGIYRAPITLTDQGDYTISVKWTDGTATEYIPFPVEVKSADMSDLETLLAALQADMTSVKNQVDTLDETELNGISEQVAAIDTTVNNIKTLIDDEDGATVNSVMEFVTAINTALADGGSGLAALKTYTDNLELMLEGKAYTDTNGNPVTEADSKGLAEIFAAIESNGTDIATANAAITNLDSDVAAFKTSVEAKVDQVQADLTQGITDVRADIAAVQTVVNANAAILGNVAFGNSALKDLIDNLDGDLVTALAAVNTRFDTVDAANTTNTTTITDAIAALDAVVDAGIVTVTDAITAQTATLEGRFDTIDSALANISGAQQYKGFV